jgi:hypothetical protein
MPNDPSQIATDPALVANQQPSALAANSEAQATNETPNANTTLEDLQRQIAELRRENASHRKSKKDAEEATQKAQADALAEQGKYKELYEQQAAQISTLKPVQEQYSALAAQVASQIEAQIKDWPQEVKTFDPGSDAPIDQRLAWLEKSKPLIAKLQEQARGTNPGNGPNPPPSAGTPETTRNKFMEQMRRSNKYGA